MSESDIINKLIKRSDKTRRRLSRIEPHEDFNWGGIRNVKGFSHSSSTGGIQEAINNLPSTGGTIYVPEGTYTVSATITDGGNPNVSLVGAGRGATLVAADNLDDEILEFTQDKFLVANIFFKGNKANQASGTCVRINNADQGIIDNCTFYQAKDYGLWIAGTSNDIRVSNCRASDCETRGYWVAGSAEHILFVNCLAKGTDDSHGFRVSTSNGNVTFVGCHSYDNGTGGAGSGWLIHGGTGGKNITLSGCIAEGNAGAGVKIEEGAQYITLVGSKFNNNGTFGINFHSTAPGVHDCIASGCECHGNQNAGIIVNSSNTGRIVIVGNQCMENSQSGAGAHSGILVQGTECTVVGNRCGDEQGTKTQDYGIEESGSADYNIIVGNDCRTNQDANYDIFIVGADTRIGNNLGRSNYEGMYATQAGLFVQKFVTAVIGDTLVIAAGVITVDTSYHIIDTQDADPADDLDTINGGEGGSILILRSAANGRDPTVKDGTGNLILAGDFTLTNIGDRIVLQRHGANWYELSRSNNA